VLHILSGPGDDDPDEKQDQRLKIFRIIQEVFDFETIARATLRPDQWEKFDSGQRLEFTDLFSSLLGNTYLKQIQSEYQDEKVEFLEQEMLSDTRALVKTMIIRDGMEIPVDYRLHHQDGEWKIYNIYIERRSFVTIYRDQFSTILMKNDPAELIRQLREKLEDQNELKP
jgi:phospholipid transport system substrate-binding protein